MKKTVHTPNAHIIIPVCARGLPMTSNEDKRLITRALRRRDTMVKFRRYSFINILTMHERDLEHDPDRLSPDFLIKLMAGEI